MVFLLTACEARIQPSAEQQVQPVTASTAKKGQYAKPGADVRLVNPAPVFLEPGKTSNVELILAAASDSGIMRVQISADPELEVLSGQEQLEFPLASTGNYSIPLQLQSQTPGRFYIRMQVSLDIDGQVKGRSLALAVQVGAPAMPSEKMAPSSSGSVDDVISLPAQETIKAPGNTP